MSNVTKKIYRFGDMSGIFATVNGVTEFLLIPYGYETRVNEEKLAGISPLGCIIDHEPMLHIALTGDGYSRDFTSGTTMRNADTAFSLKLKGQTVKEEKDGFVLCSQFENDGGLIARSYFVFNENEKAIVTYNELENNGEEVTVEAFPSFNLSCISPFERFHDPKKLILHKLISNWSGEGLLYSVSTDRLAFEPSWSGLGVRTEKWSQIGSMPARGQLPFVALEDTKNGVCWAAAMEAPASWEIETVFRNGNLSVGGGTSDFLTGHCRRLLRKGERIRTRKAYVTVVAGGLNEACDRLVKGFDNRLSVKPSEKSLPVVYNEYCYTWGFPTEEKLRAQLAAAKSLGCEYFVIDDGWFLNDYGQGRGVLGDWRINENAFPHGLKNFAAEAKRFNIKLGLWFEFESVSLQSDVYRLHPDWMLTYAGKTIEHRGRAFLDFRKAEVKQYLREKVIGTLKDNNIGYMKVDYNDNIGLGCDGAESYGSALQDHIEEVLSFFEEIKSELPELVLEICSSGGMRHEPRFLCLADMVSFSDAHENASGVAVACNLHRYIPPRKMQIWATIRDEYSLEDIRFTAAKAMLGRYCLSGDLAARSEEILCELEKSVGFYRSVSPVILDGTTTVIETGEIGSYLTPKGRVWLVRESLDKKEKLVYAYAIERPCAHFEIEVGGYFVKDAYHAPKDIAVKDGTLAFTGGNSSLWGCVIRLTRV